MGALLLSSERETIPLGVLYEENVPGLLVFARSLTGEAALAEDAVHQAFVGLAAKGMSAVASPRAYLYGAVRHAALNVLRGEARRARAHEGSKTRVALFAAPADTKDDEERAARLDEAVATLPENEREVVLLKVWGALTFEEVGETMGTSPFTAASRYRTALARLRNELAKEGWP
jgi:RNA polymerase sigma-70 factor (ECF subfamily)